MTFMGDYKGHEHPHESPPSMLAPLVVLAFLSIFGGFLFKVPDILENMFPKVEVAGELQLTVISVLFGLGGIALSYYMYVMNKALPDRIASTFSGLYNVIYNKYFVDEIYDATVVSPIVAGSRTVLWKGVDQGVIDGIVNGVGTQSRGIGGILRLLQSGNIRSYATWVAIGSVALLLIMGVAEGVSR
jgi:NADH-quinone oxidoreductase subunit L